MNKVQKRRKVQNSDKITILQKIKFNFNYYAAASIVRQNIQNFRHILFEASEDNEYIIKIFDIYGRRFKAPLTAVQKVWRET